MKFLLFPMVTTLFYYYTYNNFPIFLREMKYIFSTFFDFEKKIAKIVRKNLETQIEKYLILLKYRKISIGINNYLRIFRCKKRKQIYL